MSRTIALAVLATLALAAPAGAATFTVTTTKDAVDATIGGTCAIVGGGCSLRAALQEANATAAADDIVLPAGRFKITLGGTDEDAAATGDFDSTHDVTITGAGANLTVVDGNGADRVLDEIAGDLTVQRVTITGGLLDSDGAGINQDAGALVVRDSAIVGNTAVTGNGGGVWAQGSSAVIERTLIAGNHADDGGGFDGGTTFTVRASTIANNIAGSHTVNGDGGAADTAATFIDSTIVGNVAWNGEFSPAGAPNPTLRNSVLAGNVAFDQSNPTLPAAPSNCEGTVTSQGNNVSDDDTCTLAGPGDRNSLDPQLSDLGDHGGPFASIVPLPGSPLIDTGAGCDPLDMRGQGRPSGAACDIGAAETSLPGIAGSAATPFGENAAAITGAVDPALSPTTAHVEYGTTTGYGTATAEAPAAGALAVALTGLTAGTTYHARIVASNAYGVTAGPDVSFTTQAPPPARDTTAPKLHALKFPKKARGRVAFTLDERATVRLMFVGPHRVTMKIVGLAGRNSVELPAKLKAGRYAVVISARDLTGNTTLPTIKPIRLRRA